MEDRELASDLAANRSGTMAVARCSREFGSRPTRQDAVSESKWRFGRIAPLEPPRLGRCVRTSSSGTELGKSGFSLDVGSERSDDCCSIERAKIDDVCLHY